MCVCVYDDEEENEEYESECDESYSYMHCAKGPLYTHVHDMHMCMHMYTVHRMRACM